MTLKDKTAFITGGGSGIGFAIARALAREGVRTAIASRRIDFLRSKAEELHREFGVQTYAVSLDLRSKESIHNAVNEVVHHFGAIDILVNNSGIGVDALAVHLREENWDRVLDTNLKGAFLLTQAILPTMISQKQGHIINISSQAGKHGYANATAYCASKFGLIGFGQALQEEVRQHNIKITNLLPGLVQVPPPFDDGQVRHDVLQVDDLAETALYVLKLPERVKVEDIGLFRL